MRTLSWIAGSLLTLVTCPPALAQQQLPSAPRSKEGTRQVPSAGKAGEGQQTVADPSEHRPRLSPQERRQLRRDLIEAGRDIYRHDGPPRTRR